jgi:hypothetical protein
LRRRFKHWRRRAGSSLIDWGAPSALRAISRSWKLSYLGQERFQALPAGRGFLLCMWHGRMIVGMHAFREGRWHVLVSPSADGDLSEKLLRRFGYEVIRGSSSRGGARALRSMLEILESGGRIVVTPDGPRGPRHSMNPGLAWMARATGFPVIPLGFGCDRAWRLSSWDRFTIPKPRARVVYAWGEPLSLPRDAGERELERATEELRTRTLAAEREAFAHLGLEPDW